MEVKMLMKLQVDSEVELQLEVEAPGWLQGIMAFTSKLPAHHAHWHPAHSGSESYSVTGTFPSHES
jgi:hypothetical protein